MDNDQDPYQVIWSTEDQAFVGLCAAFPSLSWLADTPEGALTGVRNLVADIVADKRLPFALRAPNAQTTAAMAEADEIVSQRQARLER